MIICSSYDPTRSGVDSDEIVRRFVFLYGENSFPLYLQFMAERKRLDL